MKTHPACRMQFFSQAYRKRTAREAHAPGVRACCSLLMSCASYKLRQAVSRVSDALVPSSPARMRVQGCRARASRAVYAHRSTSLRFPDSSRSRKSGAFRKPWRARRASWYCNACGSYAQSLEEERADEDERQ